MTCGGSNCHVTSWSRDPERSSSDHNTCKAQYLENSWRRYLATIAILLDVCCEAVWSAILATVWLLVLIVYGSMLNHNEMHGLQKERRAHYSKMYTAGRTKKLSERQYGYYYEDAQNSHNNITVRPCSDNVLTVLLSVHES